MASNLCQSASFAGCRPYSKRRAAAARLAFSCRAQRQEVDVAPLAPAALKALAAGVAAAALLSSSPAHAGVKFERAQVRKVFQSEPQAPKAAAAPAEKKSSSGFSLPTPSFSLEAGSIALPGAVVGLGALGFLATKVDPGFGAFINDAMAKDSTSYAGYEEVLKSANGVAPKARAAAKSVKSGTKKLFGGKK